MFETLLFYPRSDYSPTEGPTRVGFYCLSGLLYNAISISCWTSMGPMVGWFFSFYSRYSHLEYRVSVNSFVSLQFLNLIQSAGLFGRGISRSQGRYLTQTQNKHKQTSMPRVEFEPTISVFEEAKTFHVLGRPHTNCVKTSIKTWDKRDKSWREHHDSDRCAAVFIISFVSTVLFSLGHVADIVSWLLDVLTHAGVRPTLDREATVIGWLNN
jgi:hypothetical protein